MSDLKIARVWESPTNEGTEAYRIGRRILDHHAPCDFTTNGRDGHPIKFVPASILREYEADRDDWRINVYDAEGNLRVSLPAASCGWEYEASDE